MLRSWTQAARTLARRPGFAIGAIVIIAAGIAATTGVFSIVDSSVLKPLPYPHPDRLVQVMEANPKKGQAIGLLAPGRLEDWNRLDHTFTAIAGSYAENVTETSGDLPVRLASRRVSPRYFGVFGVPAEIGRTFAAPEELSGGPSVVVISEHLWADRFQRRASVLTQRLIFGGVSYAIVGVMPESFAARGVDLWIPAQLTSFLMQARDARFMTGVGRMKPGVTIAAAQRDLARVQNELGEEFPKTDKDWSASVTDLKANRVGQYRDPLIFILGAVGLLLVVALANIAGLMLTQLQRRAGELAIRGFLGASRMRVVAGVVQEVLILAGVAVLLAIAADMALLRLAPAALTSLPRTAGLSIDWRALVVASLGGVAAALVCGAIPAWRATRGGTAATVSRSGRGISSDTRSQRLLVGGQIALATLLLSSTGLMLRSYYNLTHVDPGFDASHTATFHVGAGWDEDRVKVGQMQEQFLSALANIPGVTAVGFTNFLPASNATLRYQVRMQTVARAEGTPDQDQLTVGERSVTRGYFKAMGAHVLAGTGCPAFANATDSLPKALVNRQFVKAYANGENVVGRYVRIVQNQSGSPFEIVGVVNDIREDNLRTDAVPYLYACLAPGDWPDPEYVVRTAGNPHALFAPIRSAIHDVRSSRAVFGVMTVDESLAASLDETRLETQMITAFGVGAVALAVIGLYGLVALAVTTRRREIGIRIALGAEPRRMVEELVTRVGWIVAGGTAVGLVMTAIAQRQLAAMVFGVAPLDPATLLVAVAVLVVAAGVATLIPASRAASVDPVGAMRES
ncbi:MAG: ADOP family duplicated permease [Gemmatimonadales bacterium]